MICPSCGFSQSKVIDSRHVEEGNSIRRRRECENCKKRFTTYERIEDLSIVVVKKDGTREVFDQNKIKKGVIRACEKRPVPLSTVDKMTCDIENEINKKMIREISSSEIGIMVMEKLKLIDEIAYVRFASVYRQFKDIGSFYEELQKMLSDSKKKE